MTWKVSSDPRFVLNCTKNCKIEKCTL
jgi:hypothetical protein